MNLSDRLQNLESLGLLKSQKRVKPGKDPFLAEYLGGKIIANLSGEYVLLEKSFGQSHRHGNVCLSDLRGVNCQTVCYLSAAQGLSNFNITETIVLDTETTGLAGGSGTYPFLVGVGFYDSDRFVLKQFFMRDYGEEKALLSDLAGLLKSFPYLVTYNGKGYDLPLLRTRFILNRIKAPLDFAGHLDLLFPARRIWKQRVKDCSLSNLENKILGMERAIDIPSYLIPQAYFDYLQSGEKEKIGLILEHNASDIISLAALLSHLCQILESPEKMEKLPVEDLLSLGKQFFYFGQFKKAGWCLEKSAVKSPTAELFRDTHLLLGRLYKRIGEWQKAERVWTKVLEEYSSFCLEPYLELAKFYEHRAKEYQKALGLVERAIDNLGASISLPDQYGRLEDLYYRKKRLLRKMERA